MAAYVHSEVFARMKNIKEELTENYTTFQLLTTLDYFIENAIDPIASAYPALVDVFFAKVVAYQFDNPNVKCSRNAKATKDMLPVALFNSVTTSGRKKREHQRKMMLNRGLLFGLVSTFLKTVNTYRRLHDPQLQISRAQRLVLLELAAQRVGSNHLWPAVLQSEYWIGKAYHFKELIVQKYTRMSLMQAKHTYQEIEHVQSLNDIIQTYLIFLSKAIDRCDSRQGVLTQYIKFWFYSAKAEILKSVALESHSTSYDQLLEQGYESLSVDPDQQFELVQHLAAVAKRLDPRGAFRFALDIPESFSSRDLRTLQLFSTPTNHTN